MKRFFRWRLPRNRGDRSSKLLLILVGTAFLLFFGRLFLPQPKLFYTPDFGLSDIWNFHYPVKDVLSRSLKEGQLPFWIKSMGNGFPLFAEGQIGALYVPNLIFFSTLPTWLGWNLNITLAFLLSFSGSYWLFRRLSISGRAALISAFAFSFSGYFVTQVVHFSYLQAASLTAWIVLLADVFWVRQSWKSAALFAFVIAQQIFTGGFQWVFISLAGSFFFVLVQFRERDVETLVRKMVLHLMVVSFGFMLAAPQVLPTLELREQSYRRLGLSAREVFQFPYPVRFLISFLSPNVYGTPQTGTFPSPFEEESLGIYWENTAYLSLTIMGCLVVALLKRKKTRSEKALLALGVIALLLVLGRSSPLSFLYTYSGFNLFRVPSRFLILVVLSMTGLAGVGIDRILRVLSRHSRLRWTATMLAPTLLLLIIVDLMFFWYGYHPLVSVYQALAPPATLSVIPEDARILTTQDQQQVWNDTFFDRGWREISPYLYFKNGLDANLNLVFGRTHVSVYTPFRPIRQDLFTLLSPMLVDVSGATHIISPAPIDDDTLDELLVVEASDKSLPDYHVYFNREALARLRLLSEYVVVGRSLEGLAAYEGDFPFAQKVLFEDDPKQEFEPLGESTLLVRLDEDKRLTVATQTEHQAILVLADSYYPGWKATIDGVEAEILPANINQRAVIVPAGEHEVTFTYVPAQFQRGLTMSLASLGLFLLLRFLKAGRVLRLRSLGRR